MARNDISSTALATAQWRKASFSDSSGTCVEMATLGEATAVRDSKHPDEGAIRFTRTELAAWIEECKVGGFDALA